MNDTTSLLGSPDATAGIAAIAAVAVSFLSLLLTLWALAVQRKHNFLSVRPLGFIARADYEDRLTVKIHNNGVGPLIITKLTVANGSERKNNVLDWMPGLPEGILWDTFTTELEERSLAPGDEIILLELCGDPADSRFEEARDRCRDVLRTLSVEMEYIDIYNREMPKAQRSLSWFGRHLSTPPLPNTGLLDSPISST
jgi:hypothetical protein